MITRSHSDFVEALLADPDPAIDIVITATRADSPFRLVNRHLRDSLHFFDLQNYSVVLGLLKFVVVGSYRRVLSLLFSSHSSLEACYHILSATERISAYLDAIDVGFRVGHGFAPLQYSR